MPLGAVTTPDGIVLLVSSQFNTLGSPAAVSGTTPPVLPFWGLGGRRGNRALSAGAHASGIENVNILSASMRAYVAPPSSISSHSSPYRGA